MTSHEPPLSLLIVTIILSLILIGCLWAYGPPIYWDFIAQRWRIWGIQ